MTSETPNIDTGERMRRLAVRQGLAPGHQPDRLAAVCDTVVGLHSSDPATVYLSARSRMPDATVESIARDLYDERTVLRTHGMRRTMFVVSQSVAPLLIDGCAAAMMPGQRKRLARWLQESGIAHEPQWIAEVENRAIEALSRLGPSVAKDLSAEVPELTLKVTPAGQPGSFGLSTRILFLLAAEGRIARARPRGSWISSQYRWALMDDWLGRPRPVTTAEQARPELIRRWLQAFGPGTLIDISWWTGWGVTEVRRHLEAVGAINVTLDEGEGYVLADDLDSTPDPGPWVALLPALDPTTMGWKERDWYLGPHPPDLFDRNGNAGPTVWADGRVVGGWGQDASGRVVYRFLESVGAGVEQAVADKATELGAWLGNTIVTPRFRTPLEKELRG